MTESTIIDREYFLKVLTESEELPKELAECFDGNRPVLFFGRGNQGVVCEELFVNYMKFDVKGFLTSDDFVRGAGYNKVPSYSLSSNPYPREECNVLLTVGEDLANKMQKELMQKGYQHVYNIGDWNQYNSILREYVLWYIFDRYHAQIKKSDTILRYKSWKFLNPWREKDNYYTMFLGEFNALVAPHVFGEYDFPTLEGPYEYKAVNIQKGDVVIDCGANIGLFSSAAASIGCKVYAFEPVKFIADYLQRTADLYDNQEIEVVCKALSDHVGTAEFTQVEEDFHVLGWSTSVLSGGRNAVLPTTTIDAFVQEKNLSKVDFIKADIEGAEREMLRGARETLKKFAPKLAICTYHLPDDKEVLTELIKQANPNYVIEYQWEKLFAYVPQKE